MQKLDKNREFWSGLGQFWESAGIPTRELRSRIEAMETGEWGEDLRERESHILWAGNGSGSSLGNGSRWSSLGYKMELKKENTEELRIDAAPVKADRESHRGRT